MAGLTLFVLAHTDELLDRMPQHGSVRPVDLRSLSFPKPEWQENRLAEARWLLCDEGSAVATEYVGLLSARHEEKWPFQPPVLELARLTNLDHQLGRHRGLGAMLIRSNRIVEWSEFCHPGIARILNAVVSEFGLALHPCAVPVANTFICHVDRYHELRSFMRAATSFVESQFGWEPDFSHRCEACVPGGELCPYHRGRQVGFVCERLTMLHFAQYGRSRFTTFRSIEPDVFRCESRLQRKMDLFARLPPRLQERLRD